VRSLMAAIFFSFLLSTAVLAQSNTSQNQAPAAKKSEQPAAAKSPEKNPPESAAKNPEQAASSEEKTAKERSGDKENEEHFDMAEVAPVATHHQITVDGKLLKYTATAGRLPIKRADGKIEAEMFFVGYTLDGPDAAKRPLTFAFNGGPGSSSIWLHMGALGPRKVVLQPEGFLPPAPYRTEDNPYTLLDKTDLVLVDAIGTGFSRAADAETFKKFWGVKGDIEAFSEFIRLYITRNERWSSPLYLLGESYGTTRAAGVAGYLATTKLTTNLSFSWFLPSPRSPDIITSSRPTSRRI
jgi:carboxypeptidase C (cathepsin A)